MFGALSCRSTCSCAASPSGSRSPSPSGPIGLLVIRRTIERGWAYGFLSGVGVATADATYGAIAAFGLTAVTELLVGIDRLLGLDRRDACCVVIAVRSLRATLATTDAPTARAERGRFDSPLGAWASMVALTLTNPATILSFAALFASIGAGTGGPAGAMSVVARRVRGLGRVVGGAHRRGRRAPGAADAAGRSAGSTSPRRC